MNRRGPRPDEGQGPDAMLVRCAGPQPLAVFLPPVATKLTQSPWSLNDGLLKVAQPFFRHWFLVVGGPTRAGVAVILRATVPFGVQFVSW